MVENGTKKIKPISPTPADIKGRARISHNTTRKRTNFRLLNSRGPIGFHSQGNHCSISKLLGEGRPRRTKTFGAVYSCSRFGLASALTAPLPLIPAKSAGVFSTRPHEIVILVVVTLGIFIDVSGFIRWSIPTTWEPRLNKHHHVVHAVGYLLTETLHESSVLTKNTGPSSALDSLESTRDSVSYPHL